MPPKRTILSLSMVLAVMITSCRLPEAANGNSSSQRITPTAGIITQTAQENWAIHQALFFSFQYPSDWRVEEASTGQYVALYPPTENPRWKIEIAYLGREINPEENLLTWYQTYLQAAHGSPLPQIQVLQQEETSQPDGIRRQVLHTAVVTEMGPSQAISITYGRLVLAIATYTHDKVATEILKRIAESIEFMPNAPKTISELLSPAR
jgi:hypothetical protein